MINTALQTAGPIGFPQPPNRRTRWIPAIDERRNELVSWFRDRVASPTQQGGGLAESLSSCQRQLSLISMHLPSGWYQGLNRQLQLLLDPEEWDASDLPPRATSFATLLHALLILRPGRRPGLGSGAKGFFAAMWTSGRDQLTIECLPNDMVRWVLSYELNGQIERGGGECSVDRLPEVLRPYRPDRWLSDAQ